ncbi:hypothetical protein [Pontiella sulfatireligans]|nr:hypothetical protein [Pontiella sulfatireligans]
MKRFTLQMIVILIALSSFGLGTADLLGNADAKKVFDKKCIRLGTIEVLPIKFETACRVLKQNELINAVQKEFARSVSNNGEVEFPIIGTGPKQYHYVNEKGKRTDITELYRKQTNAHSFDYIVWASGKRFFGGYDVIIHLRVVDANEAGIIYSVSTHAYPHNWATRFSARKIGITKRYFKKKMKLISYVARQIGLGLCAKDEFKQGLMEGRRPLRPGGEAPAPPSLP